MSIASEIQRIQQAKEDIITALTRIGIVVPADANISDIGGIIYPGLLFQNKIVSNRTHKINSHTATSNTLAATNDHPQYVYQYVNNANASLLINSSYDWFFATIDAVGTTYNDQTLDVMIDIPNYSIQIIGVAYYKINTTGSSSRVQYIFYSDNLYINLYYDYGRSGLGTVGSCVYWTNLDLTGEFNYDVYIK